MRSVFSYLTIFIFAALTITAYAETNWYEGGNLHKADISTWRKASYQNKLATASDWTLISPKIKAIVMESRNIETNKVFAKELVDCIDQSIEGVNVTGSAADFAVMCMVIMTWLE